MRLGANLVKTINNKIKPRDANSLIALSIPPGHQFSSSAHKNLEDVPTAPMVPQVDSNGVGTSARVILESCSDTSLTKTTLPAHNLMAASFSPRLGASQTLLILQLCACLLRKAKLRYKFFGHFNPVSPSTRTTEWLISSQRPV